MILLANAGVVSVTVDAAPETSPRLVEYLLQAFAASNTTPLPRPPTPRRMYSALASHARPAR